MPFSDITIEQPISFKPLDWRDRPPAIQEEIDKAWDNIKDDSDSQWLHNGSGFGLYKLASLNEFLILKSIIREQYPERKEFYVLDIGAGEFAFTRTMIYQINNDRELPKDIIVHVIGVSYARIWCMEK